MSNKVVHSISDHFSPTQVVLLDVNETRAKTLLEDLRKQHGQDRTLFLSCNVESEEQMKGKTHVCASVFEENH